MSSSAAAWEVDGADTLMLYVLALTFAVMGALPGVIVVLAMPANDDVDVIHDDPRAAQGSACKSCGSNQTERRGGVLECFNCGHTDD